MKTKDKGGRDVKGKKLGGYASFFFPQSMMPASQEDDAKGLGKQSRCMLVCPIRDRYDQRDA